MSLLPNNSKILEYKIIEHLGSGGFANTYRAFDTNLNKDVAIKEFFPKRFSHRGDDYRVAPLPGQEERFGSLLTYFLEEARILAQFDEKNIVKVLRYFEALGTAYMIMEFVSGRHLGSIIQEDVILKEDRVTRWLGGLLAGLETVHGASVIHGDIKPQNIIINENDDAVLIDFGAAVAYQNIGDSSSSAEIFASVNYAAPEQLLGDEPINHRADLYSLGAVFYEIVTHERLVRDRTVDIKKEEVLAYGRFYGARLLSTIHTAIYLDPAARFSDAGAWLDELTLSPTEKVAKFVRQHRYAIGALVLVLAGVAYAAFYVVENEINRENYKYKLFASQSEIDQQLALGDSYKSKLSAARRYLRDYRSEFRTQSDRIKQANLVTGRSSLKSIRQGVSQTDVFVKLLAEISDEFDRIQAGYYFDSYGDVLAKADAAVRQVSVQLNKMTRDLFAARIENEVVARSRDRKIDIDTVDLVSLVSDMKSAKDSLELAELVPRSQPVIEDFLARQIESNRQKALAQARLDTVGALKDLQKRHRGKKKAEALSGLIDQAQNAQEIKTLLSLQAQGEAISKAIEKQTRVAEAKRQKMGYESRLRAQIQSIEAAMVPIQSGTFSMGGPNQGYARPVRSVTIKPFFLGKNEVTVGEWSLCVKERKCKSAKSKRSNFPVTGITWSQAQGFIKWLNSRSRRFRFRLPSEAEWEYVVKRYGFREKELEGGLSAVSVNNRNARGLNSVLGNALEWLGDCWHGGYFGAPKDGSSWNRGLQCNRRVVRGSSWNGQHTLSPETAAYFRPPLGVELNKSLDTLGFRLAARRK